MLSRLVITFLPRSKASFNFMAAVTICSDFGAQKNLGRVVEMFCILIGVGVTQLYDFISTGSLEGLMLKLKLRYFGHLIQRADSSEKTLMLGKIEGRRRG